jgi:hypothetical protein
MQQGVIADLRLGFPVVEETATANDRAVAT